MAVWSAEPAQTQEVLGASAPDGFKLVQHIDTSAYAKRGSSRGGKSERSERHADRIDSSTVAGWVYNKAVALGWV